MRTVILILALVFVSAAFIAAPAWAEEPSLAKGCLYRAWEKLPQIDGLKIVSSSVDFKESRRILNMDDEIYTGRVEVVAFTTPATYEFFCATRKASRYGQTKHAVVDEFEMGIVE